MGVFFYLHEKYETLRGIVKKVHYIPDLIEKGFKE